MNNLRCHKCGAPWESDKRQPGFKEVCVKCGAYLHCCRNCRFHKVTAPNQCQIPNTEPVADRSGLNFCEEFEFNSKPNNAVGLNPAVQNARDAFAKLFGDEPDTSPPLRFDDLFKE